MMEEKQITITYREYSGITDLPAAEAALCQAAETALRSSHSPYSGFRVGAAIRLKSGTIVPGSNQENAAYPSGLCAERVALFTAGSQFPGDPVEAMAITAQTPNFKLMAPVTSCGACLQVMAEYERKYGISMKIFFYCIGGAVLEVSGVNSLLPLMFFEDRLGDA